MMKVERDIIRFWRHVSETDLNFCPDIFVGRVHHYHWCLIFTTIVYFYELKSFLLLNFLLIFCGQKDNDSSITFPAKFVIRLRKIIHFFLVTLSAILTLKKTIANSLLVQPIWLYPKGKFLSKRPLLLSFKMTISYSNKIHFPKFRAELYFTVEAP